MGRGGFSLIEVLIAFTVLGMAGLGLFAMGSMSTVTNTRSTDRAAAVDLAVSQLERLRNYSFDSIPASGTDGPWDAAGGAGGIFARSWSVTPTTLTGLSTPAKTISVSVSWQGGGSASVSTLVVKPAEVTPGFVAGFPTAFLKSWEQTK